MNLTSSERNRSSEPRTHLACSAMTVGAIALLSTPWMAMAEDEGDEDEMPFAEAELFFELNNTDGDLGIHALIDGDAWRKLQIEDTRERKMLNVYVRGRLRQQGLTEIFFESAEPTFDELDPKDFFDRFPEGTYDIEGATLEGEELESETELTHLMPAPPEPTVNGEPMVEDCDAEDVTAVSAPVTIAWPAVKLSHPDADGAGAGVQPPEDVSIHNYQVVVEAEILADGEEFAPVLSVILPPGETSMTIPEEFITQAEEFKYEVLAREESFNQTAVESCFVLANSTLN